MKDELYMRRCIQLAKLGEGNVAPNPMVGAVIVHEGKIIGEGYHQQYGKAHAEVNAVNSVSHQHLLPESTIYVSLEPCSHYGKTPPCSDLIVRHRFKKVIIGCLDTFSEVHGKGIERLQQAGIEVISGVLEEECRNLNKRFFTFHEKKRPYIVLKWAQTRNGLIDNQTRKDKKVNWISSPETQVLVHKWRAENQAIMVGSNTVKNDNPSLTVRAVSGNNPIRIVLDQQLELSEDHHVFDGGVETIIVNELKEENVGKTRYAKVSSLNPNTVSQFLFEQNIQSVFIEGGRMTLQSFIDAGFWDEAHVISGNAIFDSGTNAPVICKTPTFSENFFSDKIDHYFNT